MIYFTAVGPIDYSLQESKTIVKCLELTDINHGKRIHAIKNGVWNKTVEKEFALLLSEFSPEDTVIHIHGWVKALSSAIVKVAYHKKFKILITLHDYFSVCPNGGLYDYQKQKICIRKPMSAACIFCNCDKRNYLQKLWRMIRQIVQNKNVRDNPFVAYITLSNINENTIRPYVKASYFYRVQNPIQIAKTQIDDCTKSNIYMFVGRVSEEKGADIFCKAISELKKIYNIEGMIVGDGASLIELKEMYPEIKFVGWKKSNEVAEYLQSARAIIIPSRWYEAAPLLILEAYSAALPSIVSDCCAATELIRNNENGLTFKANNIDDLKEKVVLSLDNFFLKNIQNTIKREFKPEQYSISTHVSELLKVYGDWINRD